MRAVAIVAVASLALVAALFACGGESFDPASKVDSVRLFGVRADKPYARPGDTVTLDAFYTDRRADRSRPAKLYWIPILCVNPRDDLYYLCFAPPGDGGAQAGNTRLIPTGPLADAIADAGPGAQDGGTPIDRIPTGVDLAPFLPQGPSFSFRVPDDVLQDRPGAPAPYGLIIVFNVLCAGRVELAVRDVSGGPQQMPVLCTDDTGNRLPPSDYVVGLSRVYAWADRVNTNPVVEKVTLEGADVDPAQGLTVERCTAERERECKENKINVVVSDSSWEDNPTDSPGEGPRREQIWVSYYSDLGRFDSDARLLFDTREGRIEESEVIYRAPKQESDGTLWAVVHDNRGGATFVTVPIHVR